MFRLVKMPEGEPAFFLLCDHIQCMEARRGTAIVANGDDYRLTEKSFLKSAIDEGWWIDLKLMYCPPHAREFVHAAREAKEKARQVVTPQPRDILAFGNGR